MYNNVCTCSRVTRCRVIEIGFFKCSHQYSKDGTEHAATVATAFYSGTYPGCHGNSKSGRILRRGEARRGAGQWTRWRVFQYPGRSRRTATKCKVKKFFLKSVVHSVYQKYILFLLPTVLFVYLDCLMVIFEDIGWRGNCLLYNTMHLCGT